jgi:predicted metalloendopeptidase
MLTLRKAALAAIFASTFCHAAVAAPRVSNVDLQGMDRSVRPGDDFYRYANGGWARTATIPAGQQGFATRDVLNAKVIRRVRELIQAAAKAPKGADARKVGDYYASFRDEAAIEAKGLTPLAGELAAITAIADKASLSAYLGTTLNSEADGVTGNGDHVFGVWINQGFEDADHNLPHLWQGGLGMPDRESYLDPSEKAAAQRAQYQGHVAAMLKLAGVPDPQTRAARVLALEVRLAQAHAPDSDGADVFKQNNPWKRADFAAKAPGMDWDAYLRTAGLAGQANFIVWQPSAVIGTSALVASETAEAWKDYLRVHLLDHYADVLPSALAAEHFAFYGRILSGAQQPPDRAEAAIAATNGALSHAVGRLYVQRDFPPEAKAEAKAMAANLIAAYRGRIANAAWMSPGTRQKALAKLAAFKIGLGYPDTWIDYSTLRVVRGDAFGNLRRAEAFNRRRNLARLKQPVDPIDWPLNPQSAGAVILFSPNAEMFAAGILQPPWFDAHGDAATNYGSAGAAIAHEIGHSFDELGNIYDARGRLGDWWTAEDRARYHTAAAKVAAQLDGECPFPGVCVKGKQVQGETINDLEGLVVAYDAYVASRHGKADVVIGGLTGEQRFFLAFGQRWRKVQTEAALRRQIATDTHAPPQSRSDAVRNIDAWYKAFGIGPGDKLYLKPEDRVGLW